MEDVMEWCYTYNREEMEMTILFHLYIPPLFAKGIFLCFNLAYGFTFREIITQAGMGQSSNKNLLCRGGSNELQISSRDQSGSDGR